MRRPGKVGGTERDSYMLTDAEAKEQIIQITNELFSM